MTRRPERPEFATAIRGYDKLQVDDYLDRLIEIMSDAEERGRTAEAELEFSRHATVGPRVGQIFELAVEEAQELRERMTNEAEETRARSRREAHETIARARKAAAETKAEAERTGRETIAQAEASRDKVLSEVETLGEKKAGLLGDLDRLQQMLAAATRSVTGSDREKRRPAGPKKGAGQAAASQATS